MVRPLPTAYCRYLLPLRIATAYCHCRYGLPLPLLVSLSLTQPAADCLLLQPTATVVRQPILASG